MMDWKKEREKLEASILELNLHLTSLPYALQNGALARAIRTLIESARKKVELLKKEEGRLL